MATGISVVALLLTAAGAFAQLKHSINSIWGVPHFTQLKTRRQVVIWPMGWPWSSGSDSCWSWSLSPPPSSLSDWLGPGALIPRANALLTFGLIGSPDAALYKLLPDAPVTWRGALLGAAVSGLLAIAALAVVASFFWCVALNTAAMIGG